MTIVTRNCPACGTDNCAVPPSPYSCGEWKIKTCRQCGLVFLENVPDYQTLEKDFPWESTRRAEKIRRVQQRGNLNWAYKAVDSTRLWLNSVLKRNKLQNLCSQYFNKGDVLDLGCDTGDDAAIIPSGCRPIGVEISEATARIAAPKFETKGGCVIHSDVLRALKKIESNSVHGAILKSYLEHEISPLPVLKEIQRVLAPEGTIIIKVPNYGSLNRLAKGVKWCGFRFPDHVNYFTPETLKNLLGHAGLCIKRMRFSDRLPTSDSLWLIAGKN